MIHTNIWASSQVSKLSRDARLLYVGTITLGDDDGRLKGNAAFLRSQVFPYDEELKTAEVRKWLDEIIRLGLLEAYEVGGEEYLFHPNWTKYQALRADRKKESHIPKPEDNQMPTNPQPHDGQSAAQGKVSKGKIREVKGIEDGESKDSLTPKQKAEIFFASVKKQDNYFQLFCSQLSERNQVSSAKIEAELIKFSAYWTELNGAGTKMRWQMEKTFEIRRRLKTWFDRAKFNNFSTQSDRGRNVML